MNVVICCRLNVSQQRSSVDVNAAMSSTDLTSTEVLTLLYTVCQTNSSSRSFHSCLSVSTDSGETL